MLKSDATALGEALNGLAETFDKKPLGAKAAAIWFETLRAFPNELVHGILGTWPKTHGKFPTPAEVWKIVNDMQISEREQIAKNKQAEERKQVDYPITEGGKRAMREIRQIMKRPKRSPIAHWEDVLKTAKPGSIGYQYAKEALMTLRHKRRREPGEDIEPTSPVVPQETAEAHSEIGWS